VTTIKIPTVKITQPHESPFTISSQQVAILATIKNVTSSRNITFKVNGKTIRNFSYKPKGNAFEGTITLKEGQNNIVITASNGKKTASDIAWKLIDLVDNYYTQACSDLERLLHACFCVISNAKMPSDNSEDI